MTGSAPILQCNRHACRSLLVLHRERVECAQVALHDGHCDPVAGVHAASLHVLLVRAAPAKDPPPALSTARAHEPDAERRAGGGRRRSKQRPLAHKRVLERRHASAAAAGEQQRLRQRERVPRAGVPAQPVPSAARRHAVAVVFARRSPLPRAARRRAAPDFQSVLSAALLSRPLQTAIWRCACVHNSNLRSVELVTLANT